MYFLRDLRSVWRFFTDKISNVNTLLLCCMCQCHVVYINVIREVNGIAKAYTSVLYAAMSQIDVVCHTSFLQCGIKIRQHTFCLRSIRDHRDHFC